MQARQMLVGQMQQMVQRQALRELAEFVAFLGTNQCVQALPELAVFFLLGNLGQQRLLPGTPLRIVSQTSAVGAQLFGLLCALGFQCRNVCVHGLRGGFTQCLCQQRGQPLAGVRAYASRALRCGVQLFTQRLQAVALLLGQQGRSVCASIGKRAGLQGLQPHGLGLIGGQLQLLQAGFCLGDLPLHGCQGLLSLRQLRHCLGQAGWQSARGVGCVSGQGGKGLAALLPMRGILRGLLAMLLQPLQLLHQCLQCALLLLPCLPFLLARVEPVADCCCGWQVIAHSLHGAVQAGVQIAGLLLQAVQCGAGALLLLGIVL